MKPMGEPDWRPRYDDPCSQGKYPQQENSMKKLITLMLGMTIVLGSTALFAETAEKDKDKDKKVSKTHKTKTKKTKAANKS
jgi:hypothetical protein